MNTRLHSIIANQRDFAGLIDAAPSRVGRLAALNGQYTEASGFPYPLGTGTRMQTVTGAFAEGERQGKGRMTYKDGSVYDGAFKADQREGKGTFFVTILDGLPGADQG